MTEFIQTFKFVNLTLESISGKTFHKGFPLYNEKNVPVLIEEKTVSGVGSFVARYFVFYCYISRLGFISI